MWAVEVSVLLTSAAHWKLALTAQVSLDVLAFRYQENDDIFDNVAGDDIGEREAYMVRPSVRWDVSDSLTN